MYRICKTFEIENGHLLSKNTSRCRMPHGHTRRLEVVLATKELNDKDMVCDFKALKLALEGFLDTLDHAMMLNRDSEHFAYFSEHFERVVPVDGHDPTSETIAKMVFDHLDQKLREKTVMHDDRGNEYRIGDGVSLERVRISEGSASWAEFSAQ